MGYHCDVERTDKWGATALIVAAKGGHVQGTAHLLSSGANPNATSNNGATALIRAAAGGHAGCVALLLGAKANPDHVSHGSHDSITGCLSPDTSHAKPCPAPPTQDPPNTAVTEAVTPTRKRKRGKQRKKKRAPPA